jgi:hypothetical protein
MAHRVLAETTVNSWELKKNPMARLRLVAGVQAHGVVVPVVTLGKGERSPYGGLVFMVSMPQGRHPGAI